MADALKDFFRRIRIHGSCVSGLRQTVKVLEAKQPVKLVFLANDCDEKNYVALVTALAKKHGVSLITRFPKKQLGELAGQYRMKGTVTEEKHIADRKQGKVVGASSLAILDFGNLTEEDQKTFNDLLQ